MFSTTQLELQTPLQIGETLGIEFDYNGDLNDIVHVQPGCGCISNEYKKENGKLIIMYTDNVGTAVSPELKETHYPTGYVEFVKHATVYFKDEHNLMVTEGLENKYNPLKKQTVLSFKGKVQL